jgi:hypothetical protein
MQTIELGASSTLFLATRRNNGSIAIAFTWQVLFGWDFLHHKSQLVGESKKEVDDTRGPLYQAQEKDWLAMIRFHCRTDCSIIGRRVDRFHCAATRSCWVVVCIVILSLQQGLDGMKQGFHHGWPLHHVSGQDDVNPLRA